MMKNPEKYSVFWAPCMKTLEKLGKNGPV